jgi:DNA invertase Pin-like site-specific DNA recombinase
MSPDMGTPLRAPSAVAGYARHSDRRQAQSVEQQIAEFNRYCQAHALRLHAQGVFSDRALSGKSDVGREGLDALMRFLETRPRPVSAVLLWASSRLARNADDAAWYKSSIRRAGYKILYVGEDSLNTDDPIRHILEAVTEYKDEQYLRDLARDVRRGMLAHAGQGQAVSRPPCGYRIAARAGHGFELDSNRADTCRRAWELRAAGYSLSQVHEATRLFKTEYGYVNWLVPLDGWM